MQINSEKKKENLYENFLLNLQIVKISDKHKKFSQEENDEKYDEDGNLKWFM